MDGICCENCRWYEPHDPDEDGDESPYGDCTVPMPDSITDDSKIKLRPMGFWEGQFCLCHDYEDEIDREERNKPAPVKPETEEERLLRRAKELNLINPNAKPN